MNDTLKYALFFTGGIALGLLGAAAVNKEGLRPLATDLLSRGIDMKETMLRKMEIIKEGAEDLLAEAKQASEIRHERGDGEEAPENA